MRFPRAAQVLAGLLLAASLGLGGEAVAGKRLSPPESLPGVPVHRSLVDPSLPVCRVGEHGESYGNENVIYFDADDRYYTWLHVTADSCALCTSKTFARVTMAHLGLYFPSSPDTFSVEVSVVQIVPVACRFQDPEVAICTPFEVSLIYDLEPVRFNIFDIPFPTECLIQNPPAGNGQAFLGFTFLSGSDTAVATRPRIAVQQDANQCRSYNPVGTTNFDFVVEYTTGNPIMYADIELCESVAVRKRSWGQLKLLYRPRD